MKIVVYQTLGKHLRKFIQRSINERATISLLFGAGMTNDVLNICQLLYNKMKADKALPGTFNAILARKYTESGNLLISMAYIGEIVVGFKASIVESHHLRSWVSGFVFREDEFHVYVISGAHQFLEWETMLYCCQNGIFFYD